MERNEAVVSARLRELLAARGISEVELARRMGFTQSYVSRRMRGEVAWDVDDLNRIAGHLGVPVADLTAGATRLERVW